MRTHRRAPPPWRSTSSRAIDGNWIEGVPGPLQSSPDRVANRPIVARKAAHCHASSGPLDAPAQGSDVPPAPSTTTLSRRTPLMPRVPDQAQCYSIPPWYRRCSRVRRDSPDARLTVEPSAAPASGVPMRRQLRAPRTRRSFPSRHWSAVSPEMGRRRSPATIWEVEGSTLPGPTQLSMIARILGQAVPMLIDQCDGLTSQRPRPSTGQSVLEQSDAHTKKG